MKRTAIVILLSVAACFMAGCAGSTSGVTMKNGGGNLQFTRVLENPAAFHGAVVTWGGVIVRTVNHDTGSAIFLMETPLDSSGRPEGRGFSQGLFIARTRESLSPQTYTSGRKATVVGEITGEQLGKYEGTPYVYPVVRIREINLWQDEPAVKWDWGNIPFYVPGEFLSDQDQPVPQP